MMLKFNQVSKRYANGYEALNRVEFTLQKGEMAFLTGHSGAGKSTLLKLIAMLETPSEGNIIVNGADLSLLKKREISRHRLNLGFALQSPQLLNDRSVFDNAAMPLRLLGLSPQIIHKRVSTALDLVGLLDKEKYHPQHLSGGEQQRLGIARAVVHKPALLIADEPTGNLDANLAKDIMRLFEQFNQVGVSVLIATHDLSLIADMKHRMVMLKGGRICQ